MKYSGDTFMPHQCCSGFPPPFNSRLPLYGNFISNIEVFGVNVAVLQSFNNHVKNVNGYSGLPGKY